MVAMRAILGAVAVFQVLYWARLFPLKSVLSGVWVWGWSANVVLIAVGFVAFALAVRGSRKGGLWHAATWGSGGAVLLLAAVGSLGYFIGWDVTRTTAMLQTREGAMIVGPPLALFIFAALMRKRRTVRDDASTGSPPVPPQG